MPDAPLNALLNDLQTLLRQSADPRGRVRLSPEVAEALQRIPDAAGNSRGPGTPDTTHPAPPNQVAEMPAEAKAAPEPTAPEEMPSPAIEETNTAPPPPASPSPATGQPIRAFAMTALEDQVRECRKCTLCETRTQTVFGTGTLYPKLVFVGEAPGAEEDQRGEPFVGRAGELLTDIITKGMGMKREDVYICNVLKCRPPGNRNPLPEEVQQCEPYLIRQLEQLRPQAICALGKFAAQCLLRSDASVGRLRGQWHKYQGIPLRVTYHPAYLLRNPENKRKTWEDVQEIMQFLNIPRPENK